MTITYWSETTGTIAPLVTSLQQSRVIVIHSVWSLRSSSVISCVLDNVEARLVPTTHSPSGSRAFLSPTSTPTFLLYTPCPEIHFVTTSSFEKSYQRNGSELSQIFPPSFPRRYIEVLGEHCPRSLLESVDSH